MSACCSSKLESISHSSHEKDRSDSGKDWFRIGLSALIASQAMIFGLAINLSKPQQSERWFLHGLLAFSAIVVFVLVAGPLLREALQAVMRGRIVMEQLFLAGILGAFGASVSSTITGQGSVYYEVVAVLLAIYTFGSVISRQRQHLAIRAADQLREKFDRCWKLNCCGELKEVSVREICPGDRVLVKPGEGIPVDGKIKEGAGFVRQTPLTGEPFPVVLRPGDSIYAGSVSIDETLVIEAGNSGETRQLDHLIHQVQMARMRTSSLQRAADRLVSWFLPMVLLVVVVTFIGWSEVADWSVALLHALAVLVVACPCAMGLATPIALWTGINRLAENGLVCFSGDLIERLSRVTTVVFDKTGTLSEGELTLVDFMVAEEWNREEVQQLVNVVETYSSHPIAKCFHRWAGISQQGWKVTRFTPIASIGIEAEISNENGNIRRIQIGNEGLLHEMNASFARSLVAKLYGLDKATQTLFILIDEKLAAVAALREQMREGIEKALQQLTELGLSVQVMSGDRAEHLSLLKLPNATGGLTPEDKARRVDLLQASGERVLFVGDGINDAIAMNRAYASVAIGDGAALAREAAQGEIYGNHLNAIAVAVADAKKIVQRIRSNLLIAMVYNITGMGLASLGFLHPVVAALLMLGSSTTVTWRALSTDQRKFIRRKNGFLNWISTACAGFINRIPGSRMPHWMGVPVGVALGLLGPLLAVLAGLKGWNVLLLGGITVLAGCIVSNYFFRWSRRFAFVSILSMMIIGSFGMLTGWWIDAGYSSVIRDGICICGCSKTFVTDGLLSLLNWRHGGMLLASLPVLILIQPRISSKKGMWLHGIFCFLGMFIGMQLMVWVLKGINMTNPQMHFFLNFFAMDFGMLMGMMMACLVWIKWVVDRE